MRRRYPSEVLRTVTGIAKVRQKIILSEHYFVRRGVLTIFRAVALLAAFKRRSCQSADIT